MRIVKSTLVAGLISLFVSFSSFAEKVKIGDPGWTGATAIANLLAAIIATIVGILSRNILATIFSGLASYWAIIFI